jgi:hypothetical protein
MVDEYLDTDAGDLLVEDGSEFSGTGGGQGTGAAPGREAFGALDHDEEEKSLQEEDVVEVAELRSEQKPVDMLLYPTKKRRIRQLPLFQLCEPDIDSTADGRLTIRPLGQAPARWLSRLTYPNIRVLDDTFTVRMGLMLYLAGADDPWSRLVRKAMRAHGDMTRAQRDKNHLSGAAEGECVRVRSAGVKSAGAKSAGVKSAGVKSAGVKSADVNSTRLKSTGVKRDRVRNDRVNSSRVSMDDASGEWMSVEERVFLRLLARLEPFPRVLDEENRENDEVETESQNGQKAPKLPAASLYHIAAELEKMAMTKAILKSLWPGCLLEESNEEFRKGGFFRGEMSKGHMGAYRTKYDDLSSMQEFARVLAARIRGTLAGAARVRGKGNVSKTLAGLKFDFRFLLPDGSLTNLLSWFGWVPNHWGGARLHPVLADRVLGAALTEVRQSGEGLQGRQQRDGKTRDQNVAESGYKKSAIKESLVRQLVSFAVVDKKRLGDNVLKSGKRLNALGVTVY